MPESSAPARLPSVWLLCAALVAAVGAVYGQVAGFEFLSWDDDLYVTHNPRVQAGLSTAGLAWAFTTTSISNWHPLTWLSHMLDVELFGMASGAHHLVNAALHGLNTVALFAFLQLATRAPWRAALVAALFAVHPLHVESVAWVAERKDVLSGLAFMTTLLAYTWYARRPGPWRYLAVAAALALGLMAKPMLVTVPALLLVLDRWPLQRLPFRGAVVLRRIAEKLPLLALSAASAAVTVYAHRQGATLIDAQTLSLGQRAANALVSYAAYLGKTAWPADLHIYYGLRTAVPAWQWGGAAALLLAVTAAVLARVRTHPWFAVGWLWYLGTLVPVIGLVQVGTQAMADRYTYLPLVGIFVMLAWLDTLFPAGARMPRRAYGLVLGLAVLPALAWTAREQAGHWRDDMSLYAHTLAVDPDNRVARLNLALALETKLAQSPGDPQANFLFAEHLTVLGLQSQALEHYRRAAGGAPDARHVQLGLAEALIGAGRHREAVAPLERALALAPDDAGTLRRLGKLYNRLERFEAAAALLGKLVALQPTDADAHYELAVSLARTGDVAGAIARYERTLALDPRHVRALNNLAVTLEQAGRVREALARYRRLTDLDAQNPIVHYNYAIALERAGDREAAVQQYRQAAALNPRFAPARRQLQRLERAGR